jgi:SAM-dependent methyltransferase
MPFYDNFSLAQPSGMGLWIARREAGNILSAITRKEGRIHSVLEIGPGRGPFLQSCLQRSLDYTCIDISWSLLKELGGIKRVNALVPTLPVASGVFDLVFASNVLEHMPGFRAALDLVGEMVRAAKPGGLVCHRVPNVMAWGMHFWNGDYTHGFATTPRNVSQLYLDLGLKIEALYPVSGPAVGGLAYPLSLLGKLIPSWIVNHGANPLARLSKVLYSARTTFMLGFLIIGRKAGS